MGNFYTNVVVRGATEDDVAGALSALGRTSFVASRDDFVFVYDEEADRQREGVVESLALTLATRLKCPALASLNHDDNALLLWLYDRNGTETRYGYGVTFEEGQASPGDAEFAAEIRRVFDTTPIDEPHAAPLHTRLLEFLLPGSFVFLRHARILRQAGIPSSPAQLGFRYVAQGELERNEPQMKARRV